jgi:hypothetical protein
MKKSVYLSGYWFWWGGVHKQLLSGSPIFPVRSLHILVLCDMPWSLYKRPLCSEYSGIHLIGPWWWRQGQSPVWIPYWHDLLWCLHYIITFSCREILRNMFIPTRSRPFEMGYGMYIELAWQQDDIQWRVLLDTTESLGFIVHILLSDFKSQLTELVLEIKRGEDSHALNIWIFYVIVTCFPIKTDSYI